MEGDLKVEGYGFTCPGARMGHWNRQGGLLTVEIN